ncbi:hypothetical protein [Nocardia neocaledoniensis]|uniref:hypothetical protein n=1 Tax=Nocardia neocaledoniensis TaxID=236511 RepID=UPI002458077B|nr:hypothetical protein [Nocardia neocaledoniensis]
MTGADTTPKELAMTIPTPDEITAALDVLRRVPGVDERSCLHDIAVDIQHDRLMARDLRAWAIRKGTDLALMADAEIADALGEIAARHGLRIARDPGELIGYSYAQPREFDPGWCLVDMAGTWQPGDLDMAEEQVGGVQRVVALYLPAEGGQR